MHTIPTIRGIQAGINQPVIPTTQVLIRIPIKVIKFDFVDLNRTAAVPITIKIAAKYPQVVFSSPRSFKGAKISPSPGAIPGRIVYSYSGFSVGYMGWYSYGSGYPGLGISGKVGIGS